MSDFNSLVQYTVENISRPVKYVIYKLTEFIRVVDKFVFRQVPSGAASGYATIEKIEGNTVKFNQLFDDTSLSSSGYDNNVNFTFDFSTHTITCVSGTASANAFSSTALGNIYTNLEQGHKYYWPLGDNTIGIGFQLYNNNASPKTLSRFVECHHTGLWNLRVRVVSGTTVNGEKFIPNVIDLTTIFGAGNEPSTVADFEAWMAQNGLPSVAAYNAGELLSVKMSGVKSVGFNQWDEELITGTITDSTGARNYTQPLHLINATPIPVLPATTYNINVIRFTGRPGYGVPIYQYDVNMNYIGRLTTTGVSTLFTTDVNCAYINFRLIKSEYGTTYNNDICINLSDPAKNGTYEPYQSDSADIDVTTITGINSITNVREVIFPNGMKQADYAGTVKDEIDLMNDTATVRVGSRAYQSGDESDTDVITDGTTTYYALTTPIEYTDLQDANGNPLNPRYKVEQGGTEQVLPVNTSTPTTVAPTLTTTYTKDNN